MRAPLDPIAWPSATAPPFTLTFSGSMPSSFSTATACTENASLISNRSTSSRSHPAFSATRRTASTGVISTNLGREPAGRLGHDARERREAERLRALLRHDDERGRAVVDARRVAGGHRPAFLERRLQLAERGGRRVCSDRLVAIDDHRRTLALRNRDGQDLVLEQAGLGRLRRLLMAAGGILVLRFARRRDTARQPLRPRCPCATARRRTTIRR